MKRLILTCSFLFVAVAVWFGGSWMLSAANQPLTAETISRLEPELCNGSPLTQFLTIVPIAPRSLTWSTAIEQLALVDQYKGTGRRKVWVLRLPATYVTQRTCDSGRKNWVGSGGQDLSVSQRYELGLVLMENEILPATYAAKEQREIGFPVAIS